MKLCHIYCSGPVFLRHSVLSLLTYRAILSIVVGEDLSTRTFRSARFSLDCFHFVDIIINAECHGEETGNESLSSDEENETC